MHYYLACIYVTSAEGLLECVCIYIYIYTHTHIYIWFNGRSQYENSSALEKCIGIYLFQEIAEVLVVIDPFKKPHGFKTGEFGWSAKCYPP